MYPMPEPPGVRPGPGMQQALDVRVPEAPRPRLPKAGPPSRRPTPRHLTEPRAPGDVPQYIPRMSDEAKGRLAVIHIPSDGSPRSGTEGIGVLTVTPEGLAWEIRKLIRRGQSGVTGWSDVTAWEFGEALGMGARPGSYAVIVRWTTGNALLINGGPEALRRYTILTERAMDFIAPEFFEIAL
jgi:hypothetical protein